MAATKTDILNSSKSSAGLAAIKRRAAGRSKRLRIRNGEGLDAVLPKDLRVLVRNIGDLRIVGVAVVGRCGECRSSR